MVRWIRIHLSMQGTQVPSLIQEDSTCHRATQPVLHDYWAPALEPSSHNSWACTPRVCAHTRAAFTMRSPSTTTGVSPAHHNYRKPLCSIKDSAQSKINRTSFFFLKKDKSQMCQNILGPFHCLFFPSSFIEIEQHPFWRGDVMWPFTDEETEAQGGDVTCSRWRR